MRNLQEKWDRLKVRPVGYEGRSYNDNVREMDAFVVKLLAEIERLRSISMESEIPCCRCHGVVVEFSVANDAWSTLIRGNGKETDQEYLCLDCFARVAAEKVERLQTVLQQIVAVQVDPSRKHGMSLFGALMWCKREAAKAAEGEENET